MARKRTRNYSYHAKPPPSRTLRFCSSTEALKDRCCWGSIPSVRIAGYTHLISTSSPRATSYCQLTIAAVPAMALTTERPTTSAPAAAASSMTCSAPSPICEADRTSTLIDWASGAQATGDSSINSVLIDGVWALRFVFEEPGMARLEGHG